MTKEEELQNSLSKTIDYYENYISKLNHQSVMVYASARNYENQLAVTEKALELACEMLCGVTVWDNELVFDEARKDCCEYFIERAKEMMKSE